jgi:molybdopterin converting factor small subunit
VEELTRSDLTEENIKREKELVAELEKLLEQEETYWAQRSRVNWLKLGDKKNTSYFHNFASSRRSRNRIKGLRDQSGAMREGTDQLNPMISDYFAGLFTTEVDEPDPELIEKVVPRVNNEMNAELLKPYTADEVKKALFQLGI